MKVHQGGPRHQIEDQHHHRREQVEARREEKIEELVNWAKEHGLDPDSIGTDAMSKIEKLMAWAEQNGVEVNNLNDVAVWAREQGFKEGGMEEVHAEFAEVAETIAPDGAERTEIGDEGAIVHDEQLAGIREQIENSEWVPAEVRTVSPEEMTALIGGDTLQEMLGSGDETIRDDAGTVIGHIAERMNGTWKAQIAKAKDLGVLGSIQTAAGAIRAASDRGDVEGTGEIVKKELAEAAEVMVKKGAGKGGGVGGFVGDVSSLAMAVLRESYSDNLEDLESMSQKVRFFNKVKRNMRDELKSAREALGKAPSSKEQPDSQVKVDYQGMKFDTSVQYGTWEPKAAEKGDKVSNKEQLRNYVQNMESDLSTVGDDAQLANMDLQNLLQKQSQTMQTMSAVSKVVHNTLMGITRNML